MVCPEADREELEGHAQEGPAALRVVVTMGDIMALHDGR